MTVTPFPHSGYRRDPAAQRSCVSPMGNTQTQPLLGSPETSPEVSGRLRDTVIAAAVFVLLGVIVWWAA
jgi:hypothetical protein